MATSSVGARAATYHYVDWAAASPQGGTATGTITLPDSSTVQVTFAAKNQDGSPGSFAFAQTDGGTNYWVPDAPYLSAEVENAPPDPDLLALQGGQGQTYIVTLSEPIKDPIMAITSLGSSSITITYDFDSPFRIVSQGAGYWGGGPDQLVQLPDDVLQGNEGAGTIQFLGTFSTFSWLVPNTEYWHGFTFGIRTTERLEPPPDGGADAGLGADAAVPDASWDGALDGSANSGADGSANGSGTPGDAGADVGDAGDADAGDDLKNPIRNLDSGCGCRTASSAPGGAGLGALALVAAAFVVRRARRAPR